MFVSSSFCSKEEGFDLSSLELGGVELLVPMNPHELSEGWGSAETGLLLV